MQKKPTLYVMPRNNHSEKALDIVKEHFKRFTVVILQSSEEFEAAWQDKGITQVPTLIYNKRKFEGLGSIESFLEGLGEIKSLLEKP